MTSNRNDMEIAYAECPRDAGVQTNLHCSRCEDPICPSCMIYTPVGSKCPACASIGGPAMFKVTANDIARGVAMGGILAIAMGVAISVLLLALWNLKVLEGVSGQIWVIINGILQFGATYLIAVVMGNIVGKKYSTSLRVMAAMLALLFFITETIAISPLSAISGWPGDHTLILNFGGIIGFAFGTYYGMNRFKM